MSYWLRFYTSGSVIEGIWDFFLDRPAYRGDSRIRGTGRVVYFVTSSQKPNVVKIGRSGYLATRLAGIEREHGGYVAVLALLECNALKTEAAFHHYFSSYRIEGEWFLRSRVESFLRSAQQGNPQ